MLKFKRLGKIQVAGIDATKFKSHFALPTPVTIKGEMWVYFCVRNHRNQSHIFRGRWNPNDPLKIQNPDLVLSPGGPDDFDKDGVSIGNVVVKSDGQVLLYYLGWRLATDVPWINQIGLAMSSDGKAFGKSSQNPIVGISEKDPYSLSYPFVASLGDKFVMWYGSNLRWGKTVEEMDHILKVRTSQDGVRWSTDPQICLRLEPGDIGIARPWVQVFQDKYRLFCGIKRGHYSIRCFDGQRTDIANPIPKAFNWQGTAGEWEDTEQCYPAIYESASTNYVLYCGNRYGETGFGVAIVD